MTIKARKPTILIAISITVLAFVIFSSSLSQVRLERGRYVVPEIIATQSSLPSDVLDAPISQVDVYNILSKVVFWVLVPLSLLVTLLSPGNRKQRLIILSITAIGLLLFVYVWSSIIQQANLDPIQQEINLTVIPTLQPGTEIPRAVDTAPSPLLYYAFGLFIFIGFLSGFWFLWLRLRRSPIPIDRIAKKAQEAIEEVESGAEIKNVVIQAYYQMSQVLDHQLGIARKEAMTPREFETKLNDLGLPNDDVQQLTRVFEAVRYGSTHVNSDLEHQAISSLKGIVAACKEL